MSVCFGLSRASSTLRCSFLNVRSSFKLQSALICSKELRDPTVKKPAPWPYKTKKYSYLQWYIDSTVKRFDENTKIIVVDGNIGAGKTTFAKSLAEAFDMEYVPEPNLDQYYITSYGYDLRELDPIMPPSFKSCDLKRFYNDPHNKNVALFQYRMFMFRLAKYVDAVSHLLNTGQGIVMDRSVFSDRVFMETMYTAGYVSKPARDLYIEIYNSCVEELLRPHLIIYLDISSDTALERIKERNDPTEINSKVLAKDYLEGLEYEYKQNYLKRMEKHSELLVYDWTNYGDVEVVVEDVERIDFDRFGPYDEKLDDWRNKDDWAWGYLRRCYSNHKDDFFACARIFNPEAKEVIHPGAEYVEFEEIIKKVPGEKYSTGFNVNAGDNIWFKLRHNSYWYRSTLKYRHS